jgi:hypothetical protein
VPVLTRQQVTCIAHSGTTSPTNITLFPVFNRRNVQRGVVKLLAYAMHNHTVASIVTAAKAKTYLYSAVLSPFTPGA